MTPIDFDSLRELGKLLGRYTIALEFDEEEQDRIILTVEDDIFTPDEILSLERKLGQVIDVEVTALDIIAVGDKLLTTFLLDRHEIKRKVDYALHIPIMHQTEIDNHK